MNENEADQLHSTISVFPSQCKAQVVERGLGHITPKLHLLEEHIAPSVKYIRVGLGLLVEQGVESLHSSMNTLDTPLKIYAR